jgi:hypothetical protein
VKWKNDKYCWRHKPIDFSEAIKGTCRYGHCARWSCPECGGIWSEIGPMLCKCECSGKMRRQYLYPDMAPAPVLGLKPSHKVKRKR